jgi:hypothetical protein
MENFVFDADYIHDLACKSEREKIRKKITEIAELGLFHFSVEPECITKDTEKWLNEKGFAIYKNSFGIQISWEKKR